MIFLHLNTKFRENRSIHLIASLTYTRLQTYTGQRFYGKNTFWDQGALKRVFPQKFGSRFLYDHITSFLH